MAEEPSARSARGHAAGSAFRNAADSAFGPNAWLVDEMYERYRADPSSVAESWQDFFVGYRPDPGPAVESPPSPPPSAAPRDGQPLRGSAARLAANMEASLRIPTATSV